MIVVFTIMKYMALVKRNTPISTATTSMMFNGKNYSPKSPTISL